MKNVTKTMVGMTNDSWEIAQRKAAESGCSSVSEWFEWITLCQEYSEPEAAERLKLRRGRGRMKVIVLPDNVELPPEG